jgi:hypothetical protein
MPRLDLEAVTLDQGCAREVLKKLREWDLECSGIVGYCAAPDGGVEELDGWPSEAIAQAIFNGELGFPVHVVRCALPILTETKLVRVMLQCVGRCYSLTERGGHVADYLLGRIGATPAALRILLGGDVGTL